MYIIPRIIFVTFAETSVADCQRTLQEKQFNISVVSIDIIL